MKRFFILVGKEIRELMTPQMILPFLLVIVVFYAFGQVASNQAKRSQGPQPIAIIDQDQSQLSSAMINALSKSNFQPNIYSQLSQKDFAAEMSKRGDIIGLVFPKGFQAEAEKYQVQKLPSYSVVHNFSITGSSKYLALDRAVSVINDSVSNLLIATRTPELSTVQIKNPIQSQQFVTVKSRTAEANASQLVGYIANQTTAIPVIMFLVIILASQMIATGIASEKENKTLETLLTAPINRKMIVTAKMVGAGIVALILAAFYLFGFQSYASGAKIAGTNTAQVVSAAKDLGLVMTPANYILLGLILFLGILVALAISIILGAFSEDVKAVQGTIAPLMVLVLIPYFAVILLDVNSLSLPVKYLLYAIPFSHLFLAMPNLYLQNYNFVVAGIIYLVVLFLAFVWLAAWIFSTDKIITMRLNFRRKRLS